MAKFSNYDEFSGGVFRHDLKGDGSLVAEMLVAEVIPNFDALPAIAKQALHFAFKTASRNATAGVLSDDPPSALKRVQERMKAWAQGVWRAASESAGEPRTSLLAKAVAEVLGITPDEAAEQISAMIEGALDEAGLDRDNDADKAKIRKIGNDVRAQLRSAKDVAVVYARMQAEEAAKRAESAATRSSDAKPLAELLKR